MELLISLLIALAIVGVVFILSCVTSFFMRRFPNATLAVWMVIIVILIAMVIYFN